MPFEHTHEVIISGGGMVGLAAALAAAELGLTVALIEQQVYRPLTSVDAHFSPRVSAINPASEQLLRRLGAWQRISKDRLAVYQGMQVWDGLGNSQIAFNAFDVQRSHLGHIVENNQITEALWQQVFEQPQIEVLSADSISQWQQNSQQVMVSTEAGQTLKAKVLIAADGKHSLLREQSSIRSWQWQYHHHAIVTTVQHQNDHQQIARQVFLESGPLAFLPLPDDAAGNHYSSIVWSVKSAELSPLMAMPDDAFIKALNQAFEHRLGDISAADPRFSFELTASQAQRYFDRRLALLGDAAHAIHPLAGLGVNMGFLDVAALAEQWQVALNKGGDIGHEFIMRRYQRARQSHNLMVAGLMESLKRLYDSQHPAPVLARNFGLKLINQQPLLKRPLILAALGD